MNTIKNMRIETERLIIKPYLKEDLIECFNLMQDKELFNYLDMEFMTFEEYKGLFDWLILSYEKGFDEDFKYSFNITLKEGGKHIGWCGVGGVNFDRSHKEIYYLIGRDYWGKGYAKEAAKGMLEYSFNVIQLNEVVAMCKNENIASKKVIEYMGLRYEKEIGGLPEEFNFYNGELYFSLKRDEFVKMYTNENK